VLVIHSRAEPFPDDQVDDALRALWASGQSRPDWCFVAEREGRAVARIGYAAAPVAEAVPQLEHRLVDVWVPTWDEGGTRDLKELADATLPRILAPPLTLDFRFNAESAGDEVSGRRAFAETAGFALFQEKAGFLWTDIGQVIPESGLAFQPLAEVGREVYGPIMAACIEGTLDRNDRYYWTLCGPNVWAAEMFGYLAPGDEDSWLLARDAAGEVVGHVALGAFDEPATGTIIHIGVLPACRGRGYVSQMLAGAARAAPSRGFRHILSDVDTLNLPMLSAMRRAGHDAASRPWHVWHYRRTFD
jgi:ribosomal protein S18 acetylase RimI-like enzyme